VILACDICDHPRGRVTTHLCRFSEVQGRVVWRMRRPALVDVVAAIELAGRSDRRPDEDRAAAASPPPTAVPPAVAEPRLALLRRATSG
jgi:hypothetical protein